MLNYRKNPIISLGLIFVQKAYFAGLIFGGAYFWRGLLLEGTLCFKISEKWVWLDSTKKVKTAKAPRKQPKTAASTNSPWAYSRESLLTEGFWGAYLREGFLGGEGEGRFIIGIIQNHSP